MHKNQKTAVLGLCAVLAGGCAASLDADGSTLGDQSLSSRNAGFVLRLQVHAPEELRDVDNFCSVVMVSSRIGITSQNCLAVTTQASSVVDGLAANHRRLPEASELRVLSRPRIIGRRSEWTETEDAEADDDGWVYGEVEQVFFHSSDPIARGIAVVVLAKGLALPEYPEIPNKIALDEKGTTSAEAYHWDCSDWFTGPVDRVAYCDEREGTSRPCSALERTGGYGSTPANSQTTVTEAHRYASSEDFRTCAAESKSLTRIFYATTGSVSISEPTLTSAGHTGGDPVIRGKLLVGVVVNSIEVARQETIAIETVTLGDPTLAQALAYAPVETPSGRSGSRGPR